MNLARAYQRNSNTPKGQQFEFSENMQYFFMYILGVLKSNLINIPIATTPIDTVDKVNYQRYLSMMMSPDELLQVFSPQIINIADPNLNDQEFPALEVLERNSLSREGIYLLFNSFTIYMYVGRQCDPYFYQELFKVNDYMQINKMISEDDMFADMDSSEYLKALSGIIN